MKSSREERRKYVRIFMPGGQVRLASGMLMALVGKVADISAGGVRFVCNVVLKVGDEIDLELTLPTGLTFCCLAHIIHEESAGNKDAMTYGVQFVNLGLQEQQRIDDYIMQKLAEQDDVPHQEPD